MSFYDHILHNDYQYKINNQINFKNNLFKELELYKKIEIDETSYPEDQYSLYSLNYPLAGNRSIPELSISDYIMCLNNYRKNGDLLTVRFVNPENRYCEIIFLDANDNGRVWLFIMAPDLGDVEEIKKYSNINLNDNLIENVYI